MPPSQPASREDALLARARAGGEDAFRALVVPYSRELHVHCYRMVGSFHDAEDVLQETLLRAWRGLAGFEGRASLRAWLYRIATNACLSWLEGRSRQPLPAPPGFPPGGEGPPPVPTAEVVPLGPYPDALLDELPSSALDPQARYELSESVGLAFVAALQLLPARQRCVLLLRDLLGWSAQEIADALGTSVAAVNSALQRARATLDARIAGEARERAPLPEQAERAVVRRFLDAWESADLDALAALLTEDALLTMPPMPLWYRGAAAVAGFFGTVPAGGRLEQIRLVPTRANRTPALAAYMPGEDGVHRAYGMMVLRIEAGGIAEITGFADPRLFEAFGLPQELAEGGVGGSAPSSVHAGG
jgi:RNA polymerase sigma-70 factor (ECF subfamily)